MKVAASSYVLDCSLAMAWFFEDEATPPTEALFDAVSDAQVFVPALWPLEMANVLTLAERKGRTTMAKIGQFIDRLMKQPITIDREAIDRSFTHLMPLAKQHMLTVYDAAYLELAGRYDLPLATLDLDLRRAARASAIRLVAGLDGARR